MKIIYNKYFPCGSFYGINLFGVVFANIKWGKMNDTDKNHEFIHTLQQREMLFIPFYLIYVLEYLIRLIQYRGKTSLAYRNISFEREAYCNQSNLTYKKERKFYSWTKYLRASSNT